MRSLQLLMQQFLLEKNRSPAELSEQIRKKASTWKQVGQAGHNLTINPTLGMETHNQEGNQNPELLP